MSIDSPSMPSAELGTLPEPECQARSGPRPAAHGAAVQAVFDDQDLDDGSLYQQCRQLWYELCGDRDREPAVLEVGDAFDRWLPQARDGRDWVLLLTSSGWKAGTGSGDDYTQWYQYHFRLRQLDDDGEIHKAPTSLHLEIIPQLAELNFSDGNDIPLPYGEGSLVKCWSTWSESADGLERRMLEGLEAALGVDPVEVERTRRYKSRRIIKAEAHHRIDIGWKRQVIDTLEQSRQLIAYGGQSELESEQRRQREGYVEVLVDADRWHLLGFERVPWDIEAKVYQAPHWADVPRSEPAHHPKLEASFAGVDGDGALPHVDEWDRVMQVLREVVSSHLDWAGVGRDELVADDFQPGPAAPEYEYQHPDSRRDQLAERYESVSTQIYREATKASTTAVYDILKVVSSSSGATYDHLVELTGLARSTVRHHVKRLEDTGVVRRVGNPVLVVFPSLTVLDRADEILRRIYPDDMVEDMTDRADERRERRESRADQDDDELDDQDDDRDLEDTDELDDQDDGDDRDSWSYFADLDLDPDQLAAALEREHLSGRDVRVRQVGSWVT